MNVNNPCQLEQALLKAETAHAEYEKTLGHRDADWAWWYADYIFKNSNKGVFTAAQG